MLSLTHIGERGCIRKVVYASHALRQSSSTTGKVPAPWRRPSDAGG
jgi:hypothetical protein